MLQPIAFVIIVSSVMLVFFMQVFTKQKKIPWALTVICLLTSIWFFIPFKFSGFETAGGMASGLWFVYVCWILKKDISFKEISFILLLGILFSFFIGLFYTVSPVLQAYIDVSPHRYNGAFGNPNHLAIYAVLGISCFYFLFINKKINVLFFPIFAFFSLCSLLSLSKAGLILNVILFIIFSAFVFVKDKKKALKILATCAAIVLLCSICCFQQSKLLVNRIIEPFAKSLSNNSEGAPNSSGSDFISEFTTERNIIWKKYTDTIFKSIKTIIFGHGAAADIGNAHNWYLEFWFHYGLIGFILLLTIAVIMMKDSSANKKFNWTSSIYIVALFGYMFAESIFRTFLGFTVVLLLPALFYESTESIEKVDKNNTNSKNQIPKKIHFIWLGGNPLPKVVEQCIKSWKEILHDYEIKRWDESNVDINSSSQYLKEAYEAKKYAFAADALRFEVLYKEGGVYLDTDVLVIKEFDKFLHHNVFMGFETKTGVNPGLIMGAEKNSPLMKEMFERYKTKRFKKADGSLDLTTIVRITTDELLKKGLKLNNQFQIIDGCAVYPTDYFSPLNLVTSRTEVTGNTHTIHLCAATWYGKKKKAIRFVKNIANFLTNGWFGVVAYKVRDREIMK